jgi:hypothetical protein
VYFEFFSQFLAYGGASSEDVSRGSKREFSLHQPGVQLGGKLLVLRVRVVAILHCWTHGVGVRWRGSLVRWWDFSELGGLGHLAVMFLLFGGKDLEYVETVVFAWVLFWVLSNLSNLQDVGLGNFFDMGGRRGAWFGRGGGSGGV